MAATSFPACDPSAGASNFFTFPTWYKYLGGEQIEGKCIAKVESLVDISRIGLALVDVLLMLAGVVAVIYTIFGGIRLIMSQGDPEKIKTGRGTIINGLIGMIISIAATAVVGYIGNTFKESQFVGALPWFF